MKTTPSHTPLVSIIIPARNCIQYLGQAIESVLNQNYSNYEVLLIDDGSSDGDYSQFGAIDPRIRVFRLEGTGVSRARNTAMSVACGDFFAFLDADDVWFPGKLEAQIRYFNSHPEVGVVFGGFKRWHPNDNGEFTSYRSLVNDVSNVVNCEQARSGWLYARLLGGLLVGMNTAVIRRDVYGAIGGFCESMRQGEDYDFWLKASRVCEMHALDTPVALYRIHGESAMHRLSDENHLATLLVSASMRWGLSAPNGEQLTTEQFNRRLAQVAFDHGYSHYWHGKSSVARRHFLIAAKLDYQIVKSLAYVVLSLLPRFKPLRQR